MNQEQFPTYDSLNRHILSEVDRIQPELFFTVQRDCEIWIETLEALRERGDVALATWTTDDSFKFFKVSRFIGHFYDAISTTYDYRLADYEAVAIEGVCYTQWAANAHWLAEPKPASECRYQVSFIGTRYGERAAIVDKLRDAGISVDCFGYGWPSGPIPSERIPEIMRDSMISLNFSAGFMATGGHDLQIKARTFEVPGAGGFLLTDMAPGLDRVYEIGREIETFDGFDQLKDKILYYLDRPERRDKVARAGHKRTRECHTYNKRLKEIFDLALQRQKERCVSAGDRGKAACALQALATAVGPHAKKLSVAERFIRWIALEIGTLFWGKERGQRAARRLTFEGSIKVLGLRTFTAKSLPGRLFPYT
jgi:spore maturation protein CgeB